MSPEDANSSVGHQLGSERPRSEYLQQIEAQQHRLSSVFAIRDKINDLMALMLAGDEPATENAARDLERFTQQCRFYDSGFVFEVRNLPPESYVLDINSYRMARDGEEETFVADDIAVRGDVINLLNRQRRLRVQLFPFEGKIDAMALFEDGSEEE